MVEYFKLKATCMHHNMMAIHALKGYV